MAREKRSLGAGPESVNAGASVWAELAAFLGSLVHHRSSPEGPARVAALAVRRLGASRAAILARRPGKTGLVTEGSAGFDATPARAMLLEYVRRLAAWVLTTRAPLVVHAPAEDARFEGAPPDLLSARAFPLSTGDEVLGAFVLLDESEHSASMVVGPDRDLAFLALAHAAALVLDRDRARVRAGDLAHELERHERSLAGAERRATAGEFATEIGRELQEPLTGIAGITSRVAETLDPGDPRRSLLERVVEETARLARLTAGPAGFAQSVDPDLEPDTVNRIMSETLALVREELAGARVNLTERLGASLPMLLVDIDLTRRVFLNMLRAGMASATPGGRMKVETKRRGEVVEILVAADGERRPGRALDALWLPFHADGRGGDPALSVLRKLVREHRCTLRSASTRDWPFSLSLVVPIAGNQDRRRGSRERRRV